MSLRIASCVVALSLSTYCHAGGEAADLAARLPADVCFFLRADFGLVSSMARSNVFRQVLEDPEIKPAIAPFFDYFGQIWAEASREFQQEMGYSVEDLARYFPSGSLSVAFRDLDLAGRRAMPELIVAADTTANDAEAEEIIKRLFNSVFGMPVEQVGLTGSWAGVRTLTFGGQTSPRGPFVARIGSTLVLGGQEKFLASLREPAAGTPALAASESYQKGLARMGGAASPVFFYLNLSGLQNQLALQSFDNPEIAVALSALNLMGFQSLQCVAGGLRPTNPGHEFVLWGHFPFMRGGIFSLLNEGKADGSLLELAPDTAFLAGATSIDRAALYQRLWNFVNLVPFGPAARALLGKVESRLGVRIGEDLLASCSPQSAFWCSYPPGGGLIPGFIVACRMKDADRFESSLKKLAEGLGGRVREVPCGSRTIRVVEVAVAQAAKTISEIIEQPLPEDIGSMLALSGLDLPEPVGYMLRNPHIVVPYVREGDVIMVAHFPLALRWYLEARDGKGSLLKSEQFQRTAGAKLKGAGNLLYLRYDPVLEAAYNTVVPLAQMIGGGPLWSEAGIDLARLPSGKVLQKYFKGIVASFTVEPNSFEFTASGPLMQTFAP